uniref:BTB domain-containing protein n=1 Tax=Panagrolaimus davidi TaxID=227884 RepID=A0A914QTE1_9BILA
MSCSKISTIEAPISVRWKIPKQKLLNESKKEEWRIKSEEFSVKEISGVSYHVGIDSFFSQNYNGKCVFLTLVLKMENELKMNVNYKLCVPTANYNGTSSEFKNEKEHFCTTFIGKIDELFDPTRNFIVNDSMIITMEAIITVQMNLSRSVVLDHKLIVSTESSVFNQMIKSRLQESKENKVTITDFDYEIVETAMKFCYGINDEKFYNVENGIKLLQFSDKYDITDLKTSMETFLTNKISQMNICKITNASILANSVKLREICFEYLLNCLKISNAVADLNLLDKDFAFELMKASFSRCIL